MKGPNQMVFLRSIPLWIGTLLLVTLSGLAASLRSITLIQTALVLSGAFALYGIGFGVSVGRTLSRAK
jgi:hypothetical protein